MTSAALPPPAALVRPLDEVLTRASDSAAYDRWSAQVKATGYCSRPIRLRGRVRAVDKATGEVRPVYDTAAEPDETLLTACGQRREAVCPSCAATYRGDAWHIVASGLQGGKGVPDSVDTHPTLFVTLTAPSFGVVHSSRVQEGRSRACHPRRRAERCRHGVRLGCWIKHTDDDPCLGEPLCRQCFDYERAVLWNALAPELWRRTAIAIRRQLARVCGMTQRELSAFVRVSYVKVAEYQRRGALHFHVVVRLDGAGEHVEPPPARFGVELLKEAVRAAVAATRAPYPVLEGTRVPGKPLRWGSQLEVRVLAESEEGLSRRQIAAYIAKYATKSTEAVGGLVHRLEASDVRSLRVRDHVRGYVEAAWRLGGDERLEHLRLRRWAHALAYRGHCFTKSRRYSTTFGALRGARAAYAAGRIPDTATTVEPPSERVSEWSMIGIGYRTQGDAWLANSAAARAREHRALAREEVRSTTPSSIARAA